MVLTKKKPLLTEGPILSKLIIFALPIIATNLLQHFYNAADIMVVGLSENPDAVGAIGTSSSFITLLTNLFIGFSTGANVMVARHIGAKNNDSTAKTTHTAITLSLILGAFFMCVGILSSRSILKLLGAEEDLLKYASLYTRLYFLGCPFIALSNYTIGIFRAKGDSKTPLFVLSLSGVINVLLNLFFVLVCKLSVEGVAIATVSANAISAAILLSKLSRDDTSCKFSIKKLGIAKNELFDIIHVGLPAAIQGALFSVSNMLITSSILTVNNLMTPAGSIYQPIIKGNSAASNIESFAFSATNACHQASITFTGQNAGAKNYKRVVRVAYMSYLLAIVSSIIFTVGLFSLKNPLLSLYGVKLSSDPLGELAYNAALTRMGLHLIPFAFYAFMDVGSAVARGLKRSISSMIITLIGTCALRVLWILTIFNLYKNLESIFISYPISWVLTGICQLILVICSIRKLKADLNVTNNETI